MVQVSCVSNSTIDSPPLASSDLLGGRNRATTATVISAHRIRAIKLLDIKYPLWCFQRSRRPYMRNRCQTRSHLTISKYTHAMVFMFHEFGQTQLPGLESTGPTTIQDLQMRDMIGRSWTFEMEMKVFDKNCIVYWIDAPWFLVMSSFLFTKPLYLIQNIGIPFRIY